MSSLSRLESKEKMHTRKLASIRQQKKKQVHHSNIAHMKEHVRSNPYLFIWIFFIIAIIVAIVAYFMFLR